MNGVDRLVGIRVMGWPQRGESKDGHFTHLEHPEHGVICVGPRRQMGNFTPPWSPSTDIAAAWEVVEKMKALGHGFEMMWFTRMGVERPYPQTGNACYVEFSWDVGKSVPQGHRASAATPNPALSICLAALRFVGVPESEITAALNAKGKP